MRIRDMGTHEALICLAFLSMTVQAPQTFRTAAEEGGRWPPSYAF